MSSKLQGVKDSVAMDSPHSKAGGGNALAPEQLQHKYGKKYNYNVPSASTESKIIPAEECGSGPEFQEFFQLSHEKRSRQNEDKIIYELLFKGNMKDNAKGTYVELGAFDGVRESNTRFFDVCLGWEGLLIEGNPTVYVETVKNRLSSHRMAFAPSCKKDGGIAEFYKYSPQGNANDAKATVTVPCGPLGPVLEDVFGKKGVNFFSLDVEGAEALVLSTIDFKKVFIDVMIIETFNVNCKDKCEARNKIRAKMEEAGYKNYREVIHASDIFIHPKSPYQLPSTTAQSAETPSEKTGTATVAPAAASDSAPSNLDSITAESRATKFKNVYKYQPPSQVFQSLRPECGSAPGYESWFQQTGDARSWFDEDKSLFTKLFNKMSGPGTYVELGAYNGLRESNSRFFDVCLGWKGLMIEPNPKTYPRLVDARPQAHRISFSPTCSSEEEASKGTEQFHEYPMPNAGILGLATTYNGRPSVPVPCGPLGPVLEHVFENQSINFFSLDVEGAEAMVLKTIDFDKVKIDVMIITLSNTHCREHCTFVAECRAIMEKAGFARHEGVVFRSDLYIRPGSPFQL